MQQESLKEVFIPAYRYKESISNDLLHLVDFSYRIEVEKEQKIIRELKNKSQRQKVLQHMSAEEVDLEFKKIFDEQYKKDFVKPWLEPSAKKIFKPGRYAPQPIIIDQQTTTIRSVPLPSSQIKKKEKKEKKIEKKKILNKIEIKKPITIKKYKPSNKDEVQCQECSFSTKNRAELIEHYKVKHYQRAFKFRSVSKYCVLCKKNFLYLTSHIREKHKQKNDSFKCTICEKEFPLIKYFIDHLKIHLKKKPYICLICNHQTSQISNMKSHVSTHERRPFT